MVPDENVATKVRAASDDEGEQFVEPGRRVGGVGAQAGDRPPP